MPSSIRLILPPPEGQSPVRRLATRASSRHAVPEARSLACAAVGRSNSVNVWQRVLDRVAPMMESDVSTLDRLDGVTRGRGDGLRHAARVPQPAEGTEPATT
jgi:hypothetical protein